MATVVEGLRSAMIDVDVVIDTGFCRISSEYHDILQFADVLASKAVQEQRLGRADRVKPGAAVVMGTDLNAAK